jgi:hypothetical protein
MIRSLMIVVLMAGLLPAVFGSELWIPGGPETKSAVEARRGKTELSKLAASMKPGTWAELKTEMPGGIWSSPKVERGPDEGSRGGLHIAGWTDDGHWDSRTGQFLYMGLRKTRRFIAFSEEKNAWRSIELDFKSDNPCAQSKFGHIYGSNGFDHERSRFYHRYNGYTERDGTSLTGGISYFDAVTEKWTKLPSIPEKTGFTGQAIEYFNALDGLVILGKNAWIFSHARQKWEDLGPSPVDGYHSACRHNPYRQEVLMTGGNNNRFVMARIKKDGKIERLKDPPRAISVRSDKITVDPATGRYVIFDFGDNELTCLEFDSDKDEYRLLQGPGEQYPFKGYNRSYSVCAFVPEYGVSLWAEAQGTYVYKHDASANYPPAVALAVPAASDEKKSEE